MHQTAGAPSSAGRSIASVDELAGLDLLASPVWIFDPERDRTHWANRAAVALWGAESREELVGRDLSDMSPSSRTRITTYLRDFEEGRTRIERWTFYPGGVPTPVRCVCSGITVAGEPMVLVEGEPIAENEIDPSELRLLEGLRHTDAWLSIYGRDGSLLARNPAAERALGGRVLGAVAGVDAFVAQFVDPAEGAAILAELASGKPLGRDVRLHTAEGIKWVSFNGRAAVDPITASTMIVVGAREVGDRRKAEDELRDKTEILHAVLESMSDGIVVADVSGRFLMFNGPAQRLVGRGRETVPVAEWSSEYGLYLPDGITPFPIEELPLARAIRGESTDQVEIFVRSAARPHGGWNSNSGRPLRDSQGKVRGGILVMRDITAQKEAQLALERQAEEIRALSLKDDLTGLYNRRGFLALAEQQLRVAERRRAGLLFLFADLDGLKRINDELGHEEGDRALIETAAVLRETFRGSDVLARLGGDEFVALAADVHEANALLARLRFNEARHNAEGTRRYVLSMSVGVTQYDPSHPQSVQALLSRADSMMYEQKRARTPPPQRP